MSRRYTPDSTFWSTICLLCSVIYLFILRSSKRHMVAGIRNDMGWGNGSIWKTYLLVLMRKRVLTFLLENISIGSWEKERMTWSQPKLKYKSQIKITGPLNFMLSQWRLEVWAGKVCMMKLKPDKVIVLKGVNLSHTEAVWSCDSRKVYWNWNFPFVKLK